MKILVLAEKPSASKDYANILNCTDRHDGYFEGDKYICTYSFGHLFQLKEPNDYDSDYKVWDINKLPIIPNTFETKLIENARKQFNVIKSLVDRADVTYIINGGDAGREGELIQRFILEATGTNKVVKRLWVSSLTPEAIKKGFENLVDSNKYDDLYEAAKARIELDWLLGMNYTRAYTTKRGRGVTLSVGRCQTPILNLIVTRDLEIENFKPTPYYELFSTFQDYKGKYIDKDLNSKIEKSDIAEAIKNEIIKKQGEIKSIDKEVISKPHPQLYNLTNLQKVMNRKYGFSAKKTLDIAQKLYEEHKILSYPRTSSRYLSEDFVAEFPQRLKVISFGKFESAINKLDLSNLKATKRFVDNNKITDHHAIVPTNSTKIAENYAKLSKDEAQLFDEVVLTFISCFYPDYKYESTKIITTVAKYDFITTGIKEIFKGWKEIYTEVDSDGEDTDNAAEEFQIIPDLSIGKKELVIDVDIKSKKTKAPGRFTEASLLAQFEKYGLGTEATRAGLIETLITREFILKDKKSLVFTKLGRDLISIVDNNIKSVELTADIERKLEDIAEGKIKKAVLMNEIKSSLKAEIMNIQNSEGDTIEKEKIIVGKCPLCQGDVIKHKNGFGCSNWKDKECKFFISSEIAGVKLSDATIKQLLENKKTGVIKGFKSKGKDTTFDAVLKFNDEYAVVFDFETGLGVCPICKIGHINTTEFGYGCSNWKNGCKFSIRQEIAGKKISDVQVVKLIENGVTGFIKGFKGKNGLFDACLIIDDGKITFKFKKK